MVRMIRRLAEARAAAQRRQRLLTAPSAIAGIAAMNSALIWAHDKGVQTATEADRANADPVGTRRLATGRGPEGAAQRARAAPAPREHPRTLSGTRHRAPAAGLAEPAQEALRRSLPIQSRPVRRAAGL